MGGAVEDSLVKLGYAEADDIMKAKAEQHGLPFIELREIEIPPSVIELVPESLARENIVMPLAQGNGTIKVIMHDPLGFETIEKLRFVLNREIEVALAPKEAIVEAINKYYGRSSGETESVDSMLQEFTDTAIDFAEDAGPGGKSGTTATLEEGDAPVIKLVHLIIQEAVTMRASDIHIEPFADRVRIRYRIDGVLMERDSRSAPLARCHRQPSQDHGVDRHRREAAAAGRPDQDPGCRQGHRPACEHPSNHAWPVGGHADSRPRQHQGRAPGPGLRRRRLRPVQDHGQAAQRDLAGDRADRFGEDDHALRGAQRAEPARRQDHHGRGPGRVLPARESTSVR